MGLCTSLLLVAHLWSVHDGGQHNNDNYGIGAECRHGAANAQIGAYDNSFNRTTVYAAVGIEGIHGTVWGHDWAVGLLAGWASGYTDTQVIGGLRARIALTDRIEVAVIGAPTINERSGVAHLTISWRFGE